MKAIFESEIKYMNVLRSAFVGLEDIYGDVYDHKTGTTTKNVVMGVAGTFVYPSQDKGYIFMEGENHNQLTLTDPVEIAGMRKFLKGTCIKEIYYEE